MLKIGRFYYAGPPDNPDQGYVFFNTIAFFTSVIAAGSSVVFNYYMARLKTQDMKYDFCMKALGYERFVSRYFLLTAVFYCIGIGLIGFQYYPNSDMKYCVLFFMICSVLMFMYSIVYIIRSQLKFQTNFGTGSDAFLIDHKKIEADSKHGKRTGDKYEVYILKQAEVRTYL
jgi:quinol-cytochrome oxidoreductase complex cytochrome b subunit